MTLGKGTGRRCLMAAAMLLLPSQLLALTIEETRALLFNADVDGLEAAFRELHAGVNAGEFSQDEQRDVYEAFSVTDPRVHAATRAWREAYPDSPYAQTAQAWTDFHIGWIIRGERIARDTPRAALREFHDYMLAVRAGSWSAYQTDPSLLPASDILLHVAAFLGGEIDPFRTTFAPRVDRLGRMLDLLPRSPAEGLLAEVMEVHPNYGTLKRGMANSAPGWGGSWATLVRMCKTFAPMVNDREGFDPEVCIVDGGLSNSHDWEDIQPYANRVAPFDGPVLARWRVKDAVHLRPGAPGAAWTAREAIEDPEFRDLDLAQWYDSTIASRKGWPKMFKVVAIRRGQAAAEQLEFDPFNPKLLSHIWIGADQKGEKLPAMAELELARRGITVNVYSANAWSHLGSMEVPRDDLVNLPRQRLPYLVNATVYSDYEPFHTYALLHYLEMHVRFWDQIQHPPRDGTVSAEEIARFNESALGQMSEPQVMCPFVAAYRLHEDACERSADQDWSCDRDSQIHERNLERFFAAQRRGLCPIEMNGPLDGLRYSPVPVEIWPNGIPSQSWVSQF